MGVSDKAMETITAPRNANARLFIVGFPLSLAANRRISSAPITGLWPKISVSRLVKRNQIARLAARAIKRVRLIEELVEAPVALVSTNPERNGTIMVRDPFED